MVVHGDQLSGKEYRYWSVRNRTVLAPDGLVLVAEGLRTAAGNPGWHLRTDGVHSRGWHYTGADSLGPSMDIVLEEAVVDVAGVRRDVDRH